MACANRNRTSSLTKRHVPSTNNTFRFLLDFNMKQTKQELQHVLLRWFLKEEQFHSAKFSVTMKSSPAISCVKMELRSSVSVAVSVSIIRVLTTLSYDFSFKKTSFYAVAVKASNFTLLKQDVNFNILKMTNFFDVFHRPPMIETRMKQLSLTRRPPWSVSF